MPPTYIAENAPRGIDLGTTFSAICWWNGREPRVYRNTVNEETTQSVVYVYPTTGNILVGKEAYFQGIRDPKNMVFGIKRQMDAGRRKIEVGDREFTPIELSAEILKRVYGDMQEQFPSAHFRERCTVVTVPYYFKAHQCEATRLAAEHAGIPCAALLQEPIAASLSYGLSRAMQAGGTGEDVILIYDLGGGTFDLTLVKLQQKKDVIRFEVIATSGDDRLGGMDFDEAIQNYLLEKNHIRLDDLPEKDRLRAESDLRRAVIDAKERLGSVPEWMIVLPGIRPGVNLDTTLTAAEMNACIQPFIDRTEAIMDALLEDRPAASQITHVIPVGGSSRLKIVRELLADRFGKDKIWTNVDASLCVAEGAALYAAYLEQPDAFPRKIEIATATCHALGIEVAGGRFEIQIPANKPAPCAVRRKFVNSTDNMTSTDINIYQGSSSWVKDNARIGTIHITGLPPMPARKQDFYVTFTVNREQQLSVIVEVNGGTHDLNVQYL